MNTFYFSFQCFVIAYVYSELLIQDGHILHPLWKFFERKLTKQVSTELPDCTPDEVKSLPGYQYKPVYKIETKKHWLLKVLGGCVYCTSGQLCLWAFILKLFVLPHLPVNMQQVVVTAWLLIFSICLTILMVMTYKKLTSKWTQT